MRYTLRRHQDNESDPSFAVEVIDPWGVKCGHIARELAMELGPQVSEQAPPYSTSIHILTPAYIPTFIICIR